MRRLEVRLDWGDEALSIGTLAQDRHRVYFEYDPLFLDTPLPLSPLKLPARPGLFEHADRDCAEVFGVFDDSLPDGWGLLLMDRELAKRGQNPATASVLDRLAYIGTRAMGALTYHPPAGGAADEQMDIDLAELAQQAERIVEGSAEEVLPALRLAGGSPAGARPKIVAGVHQDGRMISGTSELPSGFRHYIVKFGSREGPSDIGAVEAAYARMAEAGGVSVSPSRIFETSAGGRYFGAERFDRDGNLRLHLHSLGGLLHASHRMPSLEYEGFLKATLLLTRDQRQVEEAYRRMVFNVLAHNRDDHVKNFAYLMDRSGEWRLAPAYDLVFAEGPGGQHTMALAGEAERPTDRHMLRVAETCDVDPLRARTMIESVRDAVGRWPHFAREAGVSRATSRRIGARLAADDRRTERPARGPGHPGGSPSTR